MRAVVLNEHGGPEVLTIREVPDPMPAPGEVLVDVVGMLAVADSSQVRLPERFFGPNKVPACL